MNGLAGITDTPLARDLRRRWAVALAIPLLLLFSTYFRLHYAHYQSGDMQMYVLHWLAWIQEEGVLKAYGHPFSNYMPFYPYMLGIGDLLLPDVSRTLIIKAVSTAGDVLNAYFAYRILSLYYPRRDDLAWLGASLVLALPSLWSNSGLLGQCDAWYTAFLLGAVYASMRRRYRMMLVWAGLGYAFKQQGMFIWPFIFILVLSGRVSWKWWWLAPAAALATLIPAWLEGRPFMEMVWIYYWQAFNYHTYGNASNFYWIPKALGYTYTIPRMYMGMALTALVSVVFAWVTARRWRDDDNVLKGMMLATLVVTYVPYLLPKMLDRYFLSSQLFAVVLAVMKPRWAIIALLLQVSMFLSLPNWYAWYVVPTLKISWYQSSVFLGSFYTTPALIMLTILCYRHIWRKNPEPI